MEIKGCMKDIARELLELSGNLDEGELQALAKEIREADRVFVAAAGRSLLMIRCLAMRLMQLGYTS